MKILITGAAGFIGSQLAYQLAERGDTVIGIDNINTYYDPNLKYARLRRNGFDIPATGTLTAVPETGNDGEAVEFQQSEFGVRHTSCQLPNLSFIRMDISDREAMEHLFETEKFDKVMNLAAQAGVRYSLKNPYAYIESNVMGFMIILECCRKYGIKHLVYASSSSVYGLNTSVPFSEADEVIRPVSIYAASKKSNELMAHAYGKLYGLHSTGLRYFTVYGPWGRPDMAPILFARAISKGKAINVFNNGDLIRDFTYVDDIVNGTIQVIDSDNGEGMPEPGSKAKPLAECRQYSEGIPVRVYNIGCSNPVKLMDFIGEIEKNMGVEAVKNFLPMQQGDVYQTNADTTLLETEVGYHPCVRLPEGIEKYIKWYKGYYTE